jgi:hypothetical protein
MNVGGPSLIDYCNVLCCDNRDARIHREGFIVG